MLEDHFDLLNRPWVPVLGTDGSNHDVSIRELLADADKIADIIGDQPPVTLCLYRLAIAICARACGPVKYDAGMIKRYLDSHEDAFRLFDEKKPFMQTPGLFTRLSGDKDGYKPPTFIAFNKSAGNNPILFNDSLDETASMTPAECARWLLATLAMTVRSNPNKGWTPNYGQLIHGTCFIAIGRTLADTIRLNCPTPGPASDCPAWEREVDTSGTKRKMLGPLDALTPRARAIRLVPPGDGDDGLVRRIYVESGTTIEDYRDHMWAIEDVQGKDGEKQLRAQKLDAMNPLISVLPKVLEKLPSIASGRAIIALGYINDKAKMVQGTLERLTVLDGLSEASQRAVVIADVVGKTSYGYSQDNDKKSQAVAAYWFAVRREILSIGPVEPAWTEALKKCAASATKATFGTTPFILKDRINEALEPKPATETPEAATPKMKSKNKPNGYASKAKPNGHVKTKKPAAQPAPNIGDVEYVRSLSGMAYSRRINRQAIQIKTGADRWANKALFKIVEGKGLKNGSMGIASALASKNGGESVLRLIIGASSKASMEEGLSIAAGMVKKMSFQGILSDLSQWEVDREAACLRWQAEFSTARAPRGR